MIFIRFHSIYHILSIENEFSKTKTPASGFILPYDSTHTHTQGPCFPSLLPVASRYNLTASSPKPSVYNWSGIKPHYVHTVWGGVVRVGVAHAHCIEGYTPPLSCETCILISNIRYRVPTHHQCEHGPSRTRRIFFPMDRSIRSLISFVRDAGEGKESTIFSKRVRNVLL